MFDLIIGIIVVIAWPITVVLIAIILKAAIQNIGKEKSREEICAGKKVAFIWNGLIEPYDKEQWRELETIWRRKMRDAGLPINENDAQNMWD